VIHPQLPLRMPCYDFILIADPTVVPPIERRSFGYYRLSWCDGRWVQDLRTYSPWHSWSTITSDSGFMRASCSPQSELRETLMGLAPPFGLATLCNLPL